MKNFKLILKSLINNDACVEGGRKRPWWIAIIMFFISMILAVVPIFVQTITKKGSSFISTTSYGFEVGAQRFVEDINEKGILMQVKDQSGVKYISLDQSTWDNAYSDTNDRGYHVYKHYDDDGYTDFEVYYVQNLTATDLDNIQNDIGEWSAAGVTWFKRRVSCIIFGSEAFYALTYNGKSSTAVGQIPGDYKHFEDGFTINSIAYTEIDGVIYNNFTIDALRYNSYKEGVRKNWLYFFDQGYLYQRGQLTWKTTLMMFGINAGITLFMGLMVFVLTRGKYNPFKVYTIFDCLLIAFWCTVSPAILTAGLGFLIKQFSQIIFPLLLGVRVMWLSMKSLRPDYQGQPQQPQSSKKEVKTVDVKDAKKKNK